jgi:hypothetical protein
MRTGLFHAVCALPVLLGAAPPAAPAEEGLRQPEGKLIICLLRILE